MELYARFLNACNILWFATWSSKRYLRSYFYSKVWLFLFQVEIDLFSSKSFGKSDQFWIQNCQFMTTRDRFSNFMVKKYFLSDLGWKKAQDSGTKSNPNQEANVVVKWQRKRQSSHTQSLLYAPKLDERWKERERETGRGGLHSTEVANLLLIQQSQVRFPGKIIDVAEVWG